jgi:iron complex outermembrane recepter protein
MALASAGGVAVAQTADSGTGGTAIEEIIVTAQKRAERLQDVPISVTSVTATQLHDQGIQNAFDLANVIPGLNMTESGGGITPFLRGVGNGAAATIGNESSVAVYLDGVYQTRLNIGVLSLADIDRIEVLKGPQGTLFGRNSSGGLIAIYTRDPTQTPTAEVTLGYGNYSTQLAKIYASGGLTNNIAADISYMHSHQGDGWGTNFATGQKWGYENFDVVRSKWIIDFADDTKLTLIGDYQYSMGDFGIAGNTPPGQTAGYYPFDAPSPGAERPTVGFYDMNSYFQNVATNESSGIQARVDHDFGFANFASISSFRNSTERQLTTGTGTPLYDVGFFLRSTIRTYTQELQLSSKSGGRFDWIFGLYYMNNYSDYAPTQIMGNGVGPVILGGGLGPCTGCNLDLFGQQRIDDYAAYSQATFHASDATNITMGLRYTKDDYKADGRTVLVTPGTAPETLAPTVSDGTNFDKLTYKFSVDHHFTEDVMSYISYSRGFKSGAYNILPFNPVPAKPEVLDATEIGIKSDLFDRRLEIDAAAFYYHIQHPQVQISNDGAVNILNAGSAAIKGIDLDTQYRITHELRAHLSAEYLDAHYTSYPNAAYIYQNLQPPYGNSAVVTQSATGSHTVLAPRLSLNGGFSYGIESSIGLFTLVGNYAWNSGFAWDADNLYWQRSYGLLDASVNFNLLGSDQWQFQLWGKNLTGQKYLTDELETAGVIGNRYYPGPPLTFGIQATYKFHGKSK